MLNPVQSVYADASIVIVAVAPSTFSQESYYISQNIGQTWKRLPSSLGTVYVSGITSSKNYLFIPSSTGLWRSSDYGSTWEITPATQINSVRFVNGRLYAIGLSSQVYYSDDYGEDWTTLNNTPPSTISNMVYYRSSVTAHVYNTSTEVYVYEPSLKKWIKQSVVPYYRLAFTDLVIAGGASNSVQISDDYGKTWLTAYTTPSNYYIGLVAAQGQTIAVASSTSSVLYISRDHGKKWQADTMQLPSNIVSASPRINTVFVDGSSIYVGTAFGLMTKELGKAWQLHTFHHTKVQTIWKGGGNLYCSQPNSNDPQPASSTIYRSTNGGASWDIVYPYPFYAVCSDGETLHAIRQTWYHASSSDGGTQWKEDPVTTIPWNARVGGMAAHGDSVAVCTTNGMYVSTDNGVNYTWANNGNGGNTEGYPLVWFQGAFYSLGATNTGSGYIPHLSAYSFAANRWQKAISLPDSVMAILSLQADDSQILAYVSMTNQDRAVVLIKGKDATPIIHRIGHSRNGWLSTLPNQLVMDEEHNIYAMVYDNTLQNIFLIRSKDEGITWDSMAIALPPISGLTWTTQFTVQKGIAYLGSSFGVWKVRFDKISAVQPTLPEPSEEVSFFPHPASTLVSLRLPQAFAYSEAVSISFYTSSGQEVLKGSIVAAKGNAQLDVSALASGTYLVLISDAKHTSTAQLVLQR